MFKPEVWEIIYNRFKTDDIMEWSKSAITKAIFGSDDSLQWYPGMSAADWWTFYDLGDLTTNDERIVAEVPLPKEGFWIRLHHAYANNKWFFNNKDEQEWYNEWIKPFDDPLRSNEPNVYTTNPEDYLHNARYYFDNEGPQEIMNQENFDMNNPAILWDWRPPEENIIWQAINKQEVI